MKQPLMEYLANKAMKANAHFMYDGLTGRKGYVIAGSAIMSEEEVNRTYPTNAAKLIKWNDLDKGENPNKKGLL